MQPSFEEPPQRISRYLLREEIAQDALGKRYRAVDADQTDQVVSVRLIGRPPNSKLFRRIEAAAHWSLGLQDDGIVGVREVCDIGGGLAVIEDFHEGIALSQLLEQVRAGRATLVSSVALRIALDAIEALSALSGAPAPDEGGRGLYAHGGLNPWTLHIGRDGRVRLSDAAIAAVASRGGLLDADLECARHRSPEACNRNVELDERHEVFVLGIVLWELLTREPLFTASDPEAVAAQIAQHVPQRLDRRGASRGEPIGMALADLVDTALAPKRAARFQSYQALSSALYGLRVEVASRRSLGQIVATLLPPGEGSGASASAAPGARPGQLDTLPPPPSTPPSTARQQDADDGRDRDATGRIELSQLVERATAPALAPVKLDPVSERDWNNSATEQMSVADLQALRNDPSSRPPPPPRSAAPKVAALLLLAVVAVALYFARAGLGLAANGPAAAERGSPGADVAMPGATAKELAQGVSEAEPSDARAENDGADAIAREATEAAQGAEPAQGARPEPTVDVEEPGEQPSPGAAKERRQRNKRRKNREFLPSDI